MPDWGILGRLLGRRNAGTPRGGSGGDESYRRFMGMDYNRIPQLGPGRWQSPIRPAQGGTALPSPPPSLTRFGLNITPAQWSMLNQPGVLHQLINGLPLAKPPLNLTRPVAPPPPVRTETAPIRPVSTNSFGNIYGGTTGLSIARSMGGTDMGELARMGSSFIPAYEDINERSPEARLAYKFSSLLPRLR